MLKEAEDELMNVLGWLCTDVASTTHLNRMKRALGRTDTEGTLGLDGPSYPGDPGPQTAPEAPAPEAPAEALAQPAAEAAATE